jgi:hypothetical protein
LLAWAYKVTAFASNGFFGKAVQRQREREERETLVWRVEEFFLSAILLYRAQPRLLEEVDNCVEFRIRVYS